MRPSFTDDQRRSRLARRHRLTPSHRTDDVVRITEDLVALHSTDPVTVYLSAAARMVHPDRISMAAALHDERTLVRHHAMRRTLWVFTPATARIAHAATTVAIAAKERRRLEQLLEANGIPDVSAWLATARADTLATIADHGPMTARRLGPLVPSLRTPLVMSAGTASSGTVAAHTRVLLVLGFEGELVRTHPTGTWINGEYHWASMRDWVEGGVSGLDPAVAAGQLAELWLRRFGPAPAADLQWWAGWSGAVTKAALARAGAVEVDLERGTGWVMADDLEDRNDGDRGRSEPWAAVLPGLDPTTMGWKQRDWFLPPAFVPELFDRNGNAGPTIWVDGRVVGGWAQRRDGSIAQRLLAPVTADQQRMIDVEIERVRATLGDTRFSVRFPAPQQAALLASGT